MADTPRTITNDELEALGLEVLLTVTAERGPGMVGRDGTGQLHYVQWDVSTDPAVATIEPTSTDEWPELR